MPGIPRKTVTWNRCSALVRVVWLIDRRGSPGVRARFLVAAVP